MDRLSNAIDTLMEQTCSGLLRPKYIRVAIEKKFCDLKFLTEKCREMNDRLGITDGYRSLGVKADLEGALHPVASKYHGTLTMFNEELDEDIELLHTEDFITQFQTARDTLKQAKERVSILAKMTDSMMENKELSQYLIFDD
ncbi:hypothetical protein RB195_017777 [Necator americanus]|uniref:Uncharacterized protein n=1 Tax=Necator americanus TaxID=51031 RepID=A0ABR1C919_NECAM